MKRHRPDITAIVILVVLICLWFLRLFYPEPQLIVTPDFGRSDAWHFSFATKVALSRALSLSSLPLWEPLLAGGFPLFAEGQVGALFLPNLILFRLLPLIVAYNSALTLTFITLAIGTYLYLRVLKRSAAASLFASLVLTFSGLPVLQMTHLTLLQGITLMPLIMWVGLLLATQPRRSRIVLLACLVAQQIFAGFPQATFMTVLLLLGQSAFLAFRHQRVGALLATLISLLLGIGLAAVQLVPSFEFLTQINAPTTGFDYHTASYFSFPLIHLKTFLSPFALGDPTRGTYPSFVAFDGSIFWENTAYMGVVPLLLVLLSFLQKRERRWKFFFGGTLLASLLLALGKYAPTYIVYSFWPFTLFRVPSRFLWITSWSLAVLSAFGWDAVWERLKLPRLMRTFGAMFLFGIALVQLYLPWYHYHLLVNAQAWSAPSPFADRSTANAPMITPDVGLRYSEAFATGWKEGAPYEALRIIPMPNSNIISRIPSFTAYAGRFLWRNTIAESLVLSHVAIGEREATISALGQKLLSIYGVGSVVMTEPTTYEGLQPVRSIPLTRDRQATLYRNQDAVARFRLVAEATAAATVKEVARVMIDDAFIPRQSVVVSSSDVAKNASLSSLVGPKRNSASTHGQITLVAETPTHLQLSIQDHPNASMLVTTDTYYPGWEATIDGAEAAIIPANISQRAIMIPKGNHVVNLHFRPLSLRVGTAVTILTFLITVGLMGYPQRAGAPRIGKKARQLWLSLPDSRAA